MHSNRRYLRLLVIIILFGTSQLTAQFGSTEQYFAQVAVGDGSATFFTVNNSGANQIDVLVELYRPDGALLSSDVIQVAPNGTQTLAATGAGGGLTVGWAKLSSANPFSATELFQIKVGSLELPRVGVLPSPPSTLTKLFVFLEKGKTNSGIAVANPSPTKTSTLKVRCYTGDGLLDRSTSFDLGPMEHLARFLNETPYFPGLENFEGSVEIEATEPVVMVMLRSDNNLLTSVSVLTPQGGTLVAGSVTTEYLADGAVTADKIADGQVVKSLNGLTDDLTLEAGSNVTIASAGKTVTIAASTTPGPAGPAGPKGDTGDAGPQGPAGDSHWQLNGSDTYYTDGRVGIGADTFDVQRLRVVAGPDSEAIRVEATNFSAVRAFNEGPAPALTGYSDHGAGVSGHSQGGGLPGVRGISQSGDGVYGYSSGGSGIRGLSVSGYAGSFEGPVEVVYSDAKLYINRANGSSLSGIYWRADSDTFEGALVRDGRPGSSQGDFQLYTDDSGNTPKLVVRNLGNVGIGTSSPVAKLHVIGNIIATGGVSSSRTLKKDIAPLSQKDAYQTLEQLEPVQFRYKDDDQQDLQLGFIAEDVPEKVATPDRTGIQPMDIIAILTKVVQEQQQRIAALEERLSSMER